MPIRALVAAGLMALPAFGDFQHRGECGGPGVARPGCKGSAVGVSLQDQLIQSEQGEIDQACYRKVRP